MGDCFGTGQSLSLPQKINLIFAAQKLTNETNIPEYNEVVFACTVYSYMAGITLFTHSHVVNGVTIVHSHPFKKGGEHSHTTVEFQLIHILDHTLVTDNGLTPLFVTSVLSLLCIFLASPQRMRYCRPCPGAISLRAPPVV